MARIAGIDLPKEKRVEIGLTYIYGIGRKSANDILAQTGINPDTRVKDLTDEEEAKLREAIDKGYMVAVSYTHLCEQGAGCLPQVLQGYPRCLQDRGRQEEPRLQALRRSTVKEGLTHG